jgi:hypothetical protein
MKATKEQIDGELMVIKLFASNYARDLFLGIYQCWPRKMMYKDGKRIALAMEIGGL